MELDLGWLLLGVPVAFALGWLASRLDQRQWRRDAPRSYLRGLVLLLDEKPDPALDAFVEALQQDPGTAELHFALGRMFRRRGEFERAVRVHQHLLGRGDLRPEDRERAQQALADDYLKAGLLDRAEAAWRALEGGRFDAEAKRALLLLAERAREWPRAAELADALERAAPGAWSTRIAHHWCEIALRHDAAGRAAEADHALAQARAAAPQSARPQVLAGQRAARAGDAAGAFAAFDALRVAAPAAFALVAVDYADAAAASGHADEARAALAGLLESEPSIEWLRALARLDPDAAGPAALQLLQRRPTLSAAQALLALDPAAWPEGTLVALRDAVAQAARPLQRYRCTACGFEGQNHFWQCPGCLGWDTIAPRRIDDA